MRFRLIVIFGLLTTLCISAGAESLWKPTKDSLYTDKKAHRVGDLVTILITESTKSSQDASTTISSKAKVDVGPGIGPILRAIPTLGLDGSTSTTASGNTSRTASLTAQLTVTITEVRPNGDLVLTGTRNVTTNNETQVIKITGVVRPDDIASDNTVLSTYVADAKIEYTGKGAIAERQKPGIVTRIFRFLF